MIKYFALKCTYLHMQSDLCHRFEVCARCGINCTSVENCSPKSLDDSREFKTLFMYVPYDMLCL